MRSVNPMHWICPASGRRPHPEEALSVEEYARFTGETLARLGITSCVVVGHSMGVQFALELARQQPSLVSHLVLIGPVVDSRRRTVLQQAIALARDSLGNDPRPTGSCSAITCAVGRGAISLNSRP